MALYSNDIILMDGTEEQGNRMSEENLGKIMGPNILHKVGGAGEGMGKEGKGREERTKGGEGRGR